MHATTFFHAPFASRRSRRGFSIVEILIVVAILAVMSTIGLYSYATYRENLTVRLSASEIQRTLQLAKNRAVNLGVPHQAVFDLENESFWVDQLDSLGTISEPKVVDEEFVAEYVDLRSIRIDSDLFSSGLRIVRFEPDGDNPYVVVQLIREADDPALPENFTSIRLFPSSSEAQIVEGDQL